MNNWRHDVQIHLSAFIVHNFKKLCLNQSHLYGTF